MALDDAVQLLDDIELVYLGGKVPDDFGGKRIDKSELEHGNAVAEHLLDILIAGAGADNALFASAVFHAVKRRGFAVLRKLFGALLHKRMAANGVGRRHDIFLRVLFIGRQRVLLSVTQLHSAL